MPDHIQSGETKGRREAMDRMKKQMVESGQSPAYAQRIVEQCARRADVDDRKPKKG